MTNAHEILANHCWVGPQVAIRAVAFVEAACLNEPNIGPFSGSGAYRSMQDRVSCVSVIAGPCFAESSRSSKVFRVPSYAELVEIIETEIARPGVDALFLRLDKCIAGELEGLVAAALSISNAAARKPIIAWIVGDALGPALVLVCGASRIYLSPGSRLGNIASEVADANGKLEPDQDNSLDLFKFVSSARGMDAPQIGAARVVMREQVSARHARALGLIDDIVPAGSYAEIEQHLIEQVKTEIERRRIN